MALRLIEMVLPEKEGVEIRNLLKEYKVLELRQVKLGDEEVLMRILLDAKQSEPVMDLLGKRYVGKDDNRVVILPVEATLPRAELEVAATPEKSSFVEASSDRIGREELYEDIKHAVLCSRIYLAMIVLSTILAAIGLQRNSVTLIIGAMVIAPLLGPNMALALGTTLGDLSLLWRAIRTSLVGIALTVLLSLIIGMLVHVDSTLPELALRTRVGWGDILLALASGCAGALAFTSGGVSGALIGVMVAVALLPPLVTFGLLLGGWQPTLAMGALSLFLTNLICVNLAGILTFLAQGIFPATWWEKNLAVKTTRIAIWLWLGFLVVLTGVVVFLQQR
jgi:uncharacterized hydrophobic protein (TIGR00341 family)